MSSSVSSFSIIIFPFSFCPQFTTKLSIYSNFLIVVNCNDKSCYCYPVTELLLQLKPYYHLLTSSKTIDRSQTHMRKFETLSYLLDLVFHPSCYFSSFLKVIYKKKKLQLVFHVFIYSLPIFFVPCVINSLHDQRILISLGK